MSEETENKTIYIYLKDKQVEQLRKICLLIDRDEEWVVKRLIAHAYHEIFISTVSTNQEETQSDQQDALVALWLEGKNSRNISVKPADETEQSKD